MPSFAFDSGLLVPTVLGRRTSTPLTRELRGALRDYLLDVVGADLFPVAWSDEADPVLTALDPAGQVVTAVVADTIDGVGLVRALARAGETAAASWLAIASRYPGGVEEFRPAWAAFRESRPLGAQPGPQLYVVAGEVDPEVLAATRVMHGVRIYSVDARAGAGGQLVVDVAPVHNATVRVLDHVIREPEQLALPYGLAARANETAEIAPVVDEPERSVEPATATPPAAEPWPEPDPEPDPQLRAVAELVGAPMPIEARAAGRVHIGSLSEQGHVLVDGERFATLEDATARLGADPGRAWLLWQVAGFPIADARDEAARSRGERRAPREQDHGQDGVRRRRRRR